MTTNKITTIGGQGKANEDRYIVHEEQDYSVFVLADGMGGRSFGGIAAEIAVNTVCNYNWDVTQVELCMKSALEEADKAIEKKSMELQAKMGCAIGCVVITNDTVFYVGLGDIRLYVQNKHGEDTLLSKDNVLTGKNGQTFLSRSLRGRGIREPLDIITTDTGSISSCSLCTDGFYRNDPKDDATNIVIQF